MTFRQEILADGVVLYCGDCRELWPRLGVFAAVFTDPPYEATMHKAKAGTGRRTDGPVDRIKPLDFESVEGIRDEVCRLASNHCSGWFIAFCSPEGIAPWRDRIEANGMRYKRACFWNKPDAAPQFNGQGPAFGTEPFVTAWCGDGCSRWNGGGRKNFWSFPTNAPDRHGLHPTEKPVALMREIVTLFANPGEAILDPFMGSGTTGVAAVNLGRRFTGIEIQEKYFDIACRRIADALKQPDMFIEKPKPLKQEALEI